MTDLVAGAKKAGGVTAVVVGIASVVHALPIWLLTVLIGGVFTVVLLIVVRVAIPAGRAAFSGPDRELRADSFKVWEACFFWRRREPPAAADPK